MDVGQQIAAAAAAKFGGERVVVAGGVLPGMTPIVAELRTAGAEAMLLVPSFAGTGPIPEGDDVQVCLDAMIRHRVDSATEMFRAEEAVFALPPTVLLDRIREFADAPVLIGQPFSAVQSLGPWPVFGARRREWVALEDKTIADELFDAADVPHPPSSVVRVADVDAGPGTVWSGDARDGFNGGADYVRWVRDEATRQSAIEFFRARCERVRVAPFVEGVPCSIHGVVFERGVAVMRPAEMVVMRVDGERGFRYAGASTYYDPPEDVRESMRAAARRMGACLRDRVGFRGTFTIDGIVGADGWVATECNPRSGAGLGYATAVRPDLVLTLTHRMLVEGAFDDVEPDAFEAEILPLADERRWGGAWTTSHASITENTSTALVGDTSGYVRAASDAEADGVLLVGPSPEGGFVRFTPVPERTPVGESVATRAVAAFAFADREFGTALGSMRPPLNVR